MALLFAALFLWQKNVEKSGYFANIYREAIVGMKWTAMLLASTRALPALYQDSLIRTREPSRAFRST